MIRSLLIGMLVLAGLSPISPGQVPAKGKKVALLVGVKRYDNPKFGNLNYTENDVVEMAKLLRAQDFEVTLLSDSQAKEFQPTRTNILTNLDVVLRRLNRNDLVLVGLAGHGVHFKQEKLDFFLPRDAEPNDSTTMISLKRLHDILEECGAGVRVLIVDASRKHAEKARFRAIDGQTAASHPRGVCTIQSCSAGQSALEMNDLRHGLFFYHLLEGMRGKARNAMGDVTVRSLANFAIEKTEAAGFDQKPVITGEATQDILIRGKKD